MKLSIPLFPFERWGGIDRIIAAMRRADALGFGSVTLPDHLINPIIGGDTPAPMLPSDCFYDLFVLGAAIATATDRLNVHISALILPYRHPLNAAKALATLDQLSHGRVKATVAAGWMEQEFEAFGIPFKDRSAMTDEYLAAMTCLWTETEPEFVGRFFELAPSRVEPKCHRSPHITLLGGGDGPRALHRVLKYCAGWAPMRGTPEQLAPSIQWLRDNAPSYDRDPDALTFWTRVDVLGGDPSIAAASAHAGARWRLQYRGGRRTNISNASNGWPRRSCLKSRRCNLDRSRRQGRLHRPTPRMLPEDV